MEKGESYKAVSEPSLFLFFFFYKKRVSEPYIHIHIHVWGSYSLSRKEKWKSNTLKSIK